MRLSLAHDSNRRSFDEAMQTTLIPHGAMSVLHEAARKKDLSALRGGLDILGFGDLSGLEALKGLVALEDETRLVALAEKLKSARSDAVATKDYSAVDAMKATLSEAGVEVRMSKDSVDLIAGPDFDPSKLEALK